MGVRVQYLRKAWKPLDAVQLMEDLRSWSARLQAEADRISGALAAGAWSVDTHRDEELMSLGKELWSYGDRVRRGDRIVYISVVKDVKDIRTGKRHIKTLKSFGRKDDPDNPDAELQARLYCNMYESAVQLRQKFGRRKLTRAEVRAIRDAFGLALGPEWVACIINGDEDVLEVDEAQQAMDSFAERDDDEDEQDRNLPD